MTLEWILFYTITWICLSIATIYVIRYLNGDFNYKDEIESEGIIENYDRFNTLIVKGKCFIIKRTYESGRIEFIKKEVKLEN